MHRQVGLDLVVSVGLLTGRVRGGVSEELVTKVGYNMGDI